MFKYIIVIAISGMLISAIAGGVYYYYSTTQEAILELTKNNSQLKSDKKLALDANAENVKTIDNLRFQQEKIAQEFQELENKFQTIRTQNADLKERLGRHELGVLAEAKPKLIEKTINNATDNVMRCFELLSDTPLTIGESNAKTAKSFNSECPSLFGGPDSR